MTSLFTKNYHKTLSRLSLTHIYLIFAQTMNYTAQLAAEKMGTNPVV